MSESEQIGVRRAASSDAAGILELRTRLQTETSFMLLEPGEFQDSLEDEINRIDRLNRRDNCLIVVTEERGQLIGMLTAYGGETRRLRHRATLVIGVAREHWGKGAATAMINAALNWSRERKMRRIELTVHTSNARAIDVYRRCGFEVEGIRRSSLLVDGRYVDEYLMAVINDE